MARKKVVPPVTPRIVATPPAQRLLVYLLLLCALLLALWVSYDYGKTQVPANADVQPLPSGEVEQRVTELAQERDALKQQIAELEQSVEQANQALGVAQARIQALQAARKTRQVSPAPAHAPVTTPVGNETAGVDNTLELDNVQIGPTDTENTYRIAFTVRRSDDGDGRVTGTIWIAVNGFSGKEPRRLSFKRLSPDRRSYVRMGFERQQDVAEDVVLPADFRPKNVLIEAKPYGDKYTGTAMKLGWE